MGRVAPKKKELDNGRLAPQSHAATNGWEAARLRLAASFPKVATVAQRKNQTPISLESLAAELRALRDLIESSPLLHRKDLARLLGVSERTITRRLARPGFPRPVYDAGRPKWTPGQFAWCKGDGGASA